jgi:hypothetical protein
VQQIKKVSEFLSQIKTGYKTSIKPEITHDYPSFWIVGSTKNIHKFSVLCQEEIREGFAHRVCYNI